MKIREYLDKNNLTIKDLAQFCGVTEPYMWRITKGINNPSYYLARKIVEFSNGNISFKSIRKCTFNCPQNCLCGKVKQQ